MSFRNPVRDAPPTIGAGGLNVPRWRQIQIALEEDLQSGRFAPGDRLPTEAELARRFGVHRNTVRRAVERLREKRLVRVEQGRGMFVDERAIVYTIGPRSRLTNIVQRGTRRTIREILSRTWGNADAATSGALRIPAGSPIQRVDLLRRVDDTPVAVGTYCYPLPRFEGIVERIAEAGSISAAMRHFDVIEMRRTRLRVRALQPSVRDAKLLGIGRTKPVVELTGVSVDQNGVPIQVARSRVAAAWLDLVFEFEDQESRPTVPAA